MKENVLRGPKEYKEDGHRYRMTVHGGLHYIRGNRSPYFSVTADISIADGGMWREYSSGCCHDEILKQHPDLADLVALHLSGMDGVPSHGAANGWYWMAGAMGGAGEQYHGGSGDMQHWKPDGSFDRYGKATEDESLAIFARHVRVPVEQARELRIALLAELGPIQEDSMVAPHRPSDYKRARNVLSKWIEQQRPRWNAEAKAAIAKHNLTVYTTGRR